MYISIFVRILTGHGGGIRCRMADCKKAATSSNDVCRIHAEYSTMQNTKKVTKTKKLKNSDPLIPENEDNEYDVLSESNYYVNPLPTDDLFLSDDHELYLNEDFNQNDLLNSGGRNSTSPEEINKNNSFNIETNKSASFIKIINTNNTITDHITKPNIQELDKYGHSGTNNNGNNDNDDNGGNNDYMSLEKNDISMKNNSSELTNDDDDNNKNNRNYNDTTNEIHTSPKIKNKNSSNNSNSDNSDNTTNNNSNNDNNNNNNNANTVVAKNNNTPTRKRSNTMTTNNNNNMESRVQGPYHKVDDDCSDTQNGMRQSNSFNDVLQALGKIGEPRYYKTNNNPGNQSWSEGTYAPYVQMKNSLYGGGMDYTGSTGNGQWYVPGHPAYPFQSSRSLPQSSGLAGLAGFEREHGMSARPSVSRSNAPFLYTSLDPEVNRVQSGVMKINANCNGSRSDDKNDNDKNDNNNNDNNDNDNNDNDNNDDNDGHSNIEKKSDI